MAAGGPRDPAPPGGPEIWSVSQVNRAVRSLLESTVDPLWVSGEIGSWTRARSGHCYFTLKDDRAQLRCVMWSRLARALPTDPQVGMQVRVHGALTLYEARGEFQMSADRLEAEGAEGLWRLAFEKLRAKLEAEGLLEAERKRPIPRFPATVGVVTSPTGAALRDILHVLERRAPWVRVVLAGSRVQGEGSAKEIAAALERLGRSGLCDVIIVGRGGGSLEDLWAFNEEPVARAVAASPVPVVSAVGHEVDVTIADLVADLRAPTPSAAAEVVAPDVAEVVETLRGMRRRLGAGLQNLAEHRRMRLQRLRDGMLRVLERRLSPLRQALDLSSHRLEAAMRRGLERRRDRVRRMAAQLHALSPLAVLERGFAVTHTPDGEIIMSAAELPEGMRFHLTLRDGTVAAESLGPVEPDRESEEES
ncbi:MAG: exodeoxyribonuclease VII large subunit [Gemmatimonadota bacterium]